MTKICIIDDNGNYRLFLKEIINQSIPYDKLYTLSKYEEIDDDINLFMLDIDLGDFSGIDVAKMIKCKYPYALIVFVSAHNDFIHHSLTVQPFYFIRKDHFEYDFKTFLSLLEEIHFNTTIQLRCGKKDFMIEENNIIYIEVINHLIIIHTPQKDITFLSSLDNIYKQLNQQIFLRLHKSFIVNKNYILSIKSNQCLLTNEMSLPIGRHYKDSFIKQYKEVL